MIKKISIKNFKSIANLNFECSNLNLITGTNSSGKSTFLQSLLLMKQNTIQNTGLNGELLSAGDFREVKNFNVSDNKISIQTIVNHDRFCLEIGEDEIYQNDYFDAGFSQSIEYLSCNRIGAEETYKKNFSADSGVGINGEYTVYCLNKLGNKRLEDELVYDTTDYTLLSQVNYWLSCILNSTVSTEEIPGTDLYKCFFNVNNTRNARPKNVGAGLSYIISVLTVCLLSEKDDVIVIENPEIHLHPKAQSNLCDFLYFISNSGRQLFIETHSDHIFNGIRAGIATEKMSKEKISINFFDMDNNCTKNNVVSIGKRGRIENCVDGLFDQFDIDLDRMLDL